MTIPPCISGITWCLLLMTGLLQCLQVSSMLQQRTGFPFQGWIVSHCMYTPHFVSSSICRWAVDCFKPRLLWVRLLWTCIYKNTFGAMLSIILEIPRSRIARSYGNSILVFWGIVVFKTFNICKAIFMSPYSQPGRACVLQPKYLRILKASSKFCKVKLIIEAPQRFL